MADRSDDPDWARGPNGIAADVVRWGFRMLAGREPLSAAESAAFEAMPNLFAMRRTLANTHEFHGFAGSLLTPYETWAMPLFLVRPPALADVVEFRFAPPSLDRPVCQMCTTAQFGEPAFAEIAAAMGVSPQPSRHLWEQAWIVSLLATAGLLGPGRRGLALMAGRERIAALLAARGMPIVATGGGSPSAAEAEASRTLLFYPEILRLDDFDEMIAFAAIDPLLGDAIEPGGFDFCWSLDMPGKLGSIAAALDVFEANLQALKPGGIAAHTVKLNLSSDGLTWEEPDNALVRRRDIEALAERLRDKGHALLPLNTHPGCDLADEQVTSAISEKPGLRQRRGMMISTSFGLAIRKGG
jgi:SAM-dependent methyltransferase